MQNISEKLAYMEFYMRENEEFHAPVETEMHFYEMIKQGNIDEVNRLYTPLGSKGFGILSEDELRNLKYHLVITIAFVTRFCVEGGMEHETAYSLSDLYIRQTDKAQTKDEIRAIHRNVIEDFTRRMTMIKRENIYSKPVIECFEYVYRNLNRQFSVSEMAESLDLTPQYLSRLFHSETGMTIKAYITKKRIETACQMLRFSDYEATEISSFLAYGSYSHFIKCFREETGLTPKQYRNKYYHKGDGMKGGVLTR